MFVLSGRLSAEHIALLQRLLGAELDRHIALDLAQVDGVDDDGIGFLARCEANGVTLANCPAYIHEWIRMERSQSSPEGDER